ncbi:copper resistance protein B [Leucothrix arctica]|nr:copper resistance protein B [Leucothrix arctica]
MKNTLSVVLLGLCISPAAFAKHKPMTMDCSQPMHAKMSFCKKQLAEKEAKAKASAAVDHSKMNHAAMPAKTEPAAKIDHSKMDHSKMNHAAMPAVKIPVSDGALATNVPMPFPGAMHMNDDPTLSKVMIDSFEYQYSDSNNKSFALDAEAWLGKDLHKLWLKTDIEADDDGELEEAELQALYSRAIDPNWDIQVGVRKDFEPVGREWAVAGFKGTAPYMIDVDAALFFGKSGQVGARLKTEYELMLTQKTALAPSFDVNFYTKDDPEISIGSGLSDANISLRLKHEFKRNFAPYIGINWSKSFGDTADFLKDEGEETSDTQLLLGVEAWF